MGIEGETNEASYTYLAVSKITFSVESAHQVVTAGNKLVEKYEDVRMAARQAPEIHMGSIAQQARNARLLLRKHPELGGEIALLHEIGSMPNYSG